jgi:hypothetical protein
VAQLDLLRKRFTAVKAGFNVVEETKVILAFLPAQENLPAIHEGRKVDQTAIQILDLDFGFLKIAKDLLGIGKRADQGIDILAPDVRTHGSQRRNLLLMEAGGSYGGFELIQQAPEAG